MSAISTKGGPREFQIPKLAMPMMTVVPITIAQELVSRLWQPLTTALRAPTARVDDPDAAENPHSADPQLALLLAGQIPSPDAPEQLAVNPS